MVTFSNVQLTKIEKPSTILNFECFLVIFYIFSIDFISSELFDTVTRNFTSGRIRVPTTIFIVPAK